MARYIMTTAEFVKRSKELHGDKYDYAQSVYVNQQTYVTIYCKACQKHFEQKPQKHYAFGEGCWDCGVKQRADSYALSFDEFIEKAHAKHGKRYEYDQSTFTRSKDKLTIRCRTCSDVFEQQGNAHLQGSGCPRCGAKQAHIAQSYGREGFLERAHLVHGEKFTYFECTDPNWTQKSTVTWQCRVCNMISEQLVLNHLAGRGCAQCSGKMKHTNETFVAKAEKVHGKGRYNYSEVMYVRSTDHVWITCNTCKLRWQVKPNNHLFGKGCPLCAAKQFVSKPETAWLDSLNIPAENRNVWLVVNNRKFNVDALVGDTVYEFDGDYYHGNPAKFARDKVNHKCGVTMGELHDRTVERRKEIEDAGYKVVVMWESEWKRLSSTSSRSRRSKRAG